MSRGEALTGFAPGERLDALSIGTLFEQVKAALAGAFPRSGGLWVRGEIHDIQEHRSGHCYIDLIDPDDGQGREHMVLKVNCWRTTWGPLKAVLTDQGVTLQPGTVVTLRGRVEFYAPRAQVNFIASEIDVASLLGRLAAMRAALLESLKVEGLLRRNASVALVEVPLRVGLVASPKSEGCNDFLSQLQSSGLSFAVKLCPAQVQGPSAPASIAQALVHLATDGCDVTVLVRGGGAKVDMGAFDSEVVARAVATHPAPVWTGIGHTGDQSVADIVASRSFVTPTECGQELVRRVESWWSSVSLAGVFVAQRTRDVIESHSTHDARARIQLSRATHRQLQRHADKLSTAGTRVCALSRRQIDSTSSHLQQRVLRIGPRVLGLIERESERAVARRRLLSAYDVGRQLERGYTLTLDEAGRIVRSAQALTPGQLVSTRFADGTVESVVSTHDVATTAVKETP